MNDSKQVKRLEPETREVFMEPAKWHQVNAMGDLRHERLDSFFSIEVLCDRPYYTVKIYLPGSYLPIYCNPDPVITSIDAAKEYAYDQYCIHLSKYVPEDFGSAEITSHL